MKEIRLSKQGYKHSGDYVTIVDDDMFEYLNQYRWYALAGGGQFYAVRSFRNEDGKKCQRFMHREIMKTPDDLLCDHKDRNCLNNQRFNLRNCDKRQNSANRRAYGTSKYLGVHLKDGKYPIAQIRTNGRQIYIGMFKTEEEAARAYDRKALEVFGEFANLNFKD